MLHWTSDRARECIDVGEGGRLVWTETTADGGTVTYDRDPRTSAFQRLLARVVGWLPIEWIL